MRFFVILLAASFGAASSAKQLSVRMKRQFNINCQLGTVLVGTACMPLVEPGGNCQDSAQCLDNSECKASKCTCTAAGAQVLTRYCVVPTAGCTAQQAKVAGTCVQLMIVSQACVGDPQCLGGASCVNKVCTCPPDLQHLNGFCIKPPSSPSGNCPAGQVSVQGICLPKAVVGGHCFVKEQCPGECVNTVCSAAPGTGNCAANQVEVQGVCLPQVQPGGQCFAPQQCVGGGACTNQICQAGTPGGNCPATQVEVQGICLPLVQPGGSCIAQKQCVGGGACTSSVCQPGTPGAGNCATNQVFVRGSCLATAQPGGFCFVSEQCVGGGACTSGVCQAATPGGNGNCAANQVFARGSCLNTAQPGGECFVQAQCVGGAACTNGVCTAGGTPGGATQCATYQVSNNGVCLDTVSIGMACTVQQQCIVANAQCSGGTCQCASGFVYTATGCVASGTAGVVQCGVNMVSVNSQCLALASLSSFCSSSGQCMAFSQCTNSLCACATGFTVVNGVCRNPSQITTNCPAGQVPTPSGMCLPQVQEGGQCALSVQCVNGASCVGSVCTGGGNPSTSISCSDTTKEAVLENGSPIQCTTRLCPTDARCEAAPTFGFVCCRVKTNPAGGNSGAGHCANPTDVIQMGPSSTPINCMQQACQAGGVCQYSRTKQAYVCCAPASG